MLICLLNVVVDRTFVINNTESPVCDQHVYVPVAHNGIKLHFVNGSDVVGSKLDMW